MNKSDQVINGNRVDDVSAIGFTIALFVMLAFPATILAQQEESKISNNAIEELSLTVGRFIENDWAVGAELLVIKDGKTLLHKSYGYSDKDDKKEWSNNTVCNIRSMTKPITSAAAQILIDQKKLDLDAPVAKYLGSFDNEKSKAITVRQVITHRSGLPLTNLLAPYQYKSLEKQVSAAGKNGPQHKPGSKFWYSDTGTDVVGRLIEKVSGESLDKYVTREILTPLGMTNTFYGIDPADKRLESVASLYLGKSKNWNRFWKPGGKPLYPFAWGSQTIYSTTSDYARFLTLFLNEGKVGDRQLLSKAAIDRMLNPVSEMKMLGKDVSYPTGFRNMQTYYGQMMVTHRDYRVKKSKGTPPSIIGHSGSDGTNSWAWPDRNLVVVYFTQSRGGNTPLRIEKSIDRLLIHGGKPVSTEDIPAEFRPLVGTYVANFASFDNEIFTLEFKNGKLVLDVPSQIPFELLKPDDKGFHAFAIAPEKIRVSFERDEKNVVIGLKMHQGGKVFDVPRQGRKANAKKNSPSKTLKKDTTLPKATDILKRYVAETGGESAFRELRTQRSIGKISIPSQKISGTIEISIGSNGKFRSKADLGALGTESSGSDGKTVWASSPFTGTKILTGAQREQAIEDTDLSARLHLEKYFKTQTVTGKEEVAGDPCYRIEFVTHNDDKLVQFFSIKSGLLSKEIRMVQTPVGKTKVVSHLSDYRKVGKYKFSFRNEQLLPGNTKLVNEIESIKVNEKFADETFKLPEKVQALLK